MWNVGDTAQIKRGRTKNKGKSGFVFAVITAPYQMGWKVEMREKLGIALSFVSLCDETPQNSVIKITPHDGRIQYRDRVWEWAHNCDRVGESETPGIERVHERAHVQTQQRLEKHDAQSRVQQEFAALPVAEQLRILCERHDLTFEYSDDHSVWKRGFESRRQIDALARQLPREAACRIWNEVVDTKVSIDYRKQFYWK